MRKSKKKGPSAPTKPLLTVKVFETLEELWSETLAAGAEFPEDKVEAVNEFLVACRAHMLPNEKARA